MTHISVYDDTAALVEVICDRLDVTEPELVDMLIDAAMDDSELGPVIDAATEEFK